MNERWWRRKRRNSPWFEDSEETDDTEKTMDDIIKQAFESPAEKEKARKHYGDALQVSEMYEPLIDIFEEDTSISVVAELPGAEKENIEIHATEDKLMITVNSQRTRYAKELTLPAKVDPKSSTASYRNHVLQINLKRQADKRVFTR